MQLTLGTVAALATLAFAAPQGVTQDISPKASAPDGCMMTYPGGFQITTVNATTAHKQKRQDSTLTLSLKNGKLMDQDGYTGYIADNYQFQFDKPPQTGAIYTSGFSVCKNNSLALGGSAVFYSCNSGNFNNLYDRSWAPQCSPIYIEAIPKGGSVSTPASGPTKAPDGQPGVASVMPSPPGTTPASQMPDHQPIAGTPMPIAQSPDHQIVAATTAVGAVAQSPDHQIVATTTAGAVAQSPDHQIVATTAAGAVAQSPDHQIVATTAAGAVAQSPDHQIVATPAPAPVTPVSKLNDGQPQAPTMAANATMSYMPTSYTGGAAVQTAAPLAMAAGAVLAALL